MNDVGAGAARRGARAVACVSGPVSDPQRKSLSRIDSNSRLLGNALKFTPEGSVTMGASYDRTSKSVVIIVRDTGVGIPQEDQIKVFEDFRQLDASPARGYGGTGLGLSICRRLAHMLGGAIELDSRAGEDATFTLRLPARVRRQ